MNKEKWIEDVLQSGREIHKVSPNPYMVSRIEARLQQETAVINTLSLRWVYSVAAAMLLLVFVNITAWRSMTRQTSKANGMQQLIREYGWSNEELYPANLQNKGHE